MRLLKSHPFLRLFNAYLIDHSQPSNINYLWNFGSLLGVCLGIQLVTGITLAMHYNPSVLEAFNSVEHIMRDVENGWLIRYLHSNTASAFFFLVYLHIGRGLYYGSYRAPRTMAWVIGTIILILMIGTGFLGYLNIAQNGYKLKPTTKITTTTNTLRTNISINNSVRKAKERGPKGRVFASRFSTNSYNHTKMNLNILDIRCIIEPNYRINDFLESKNLNPVFIYDKLDQDLIRRKIAAETKDLSGIYLILNKETLGFYVGSASTNKFNTRFSKHLLYGSGSKILKNSVKKYGLANFCFIILELFPEIVNQENNKQLLDLEDFYLKSLLPDYNILTEAGSSFGYKHIEISRIKMKSEYSEECRNRVGVLWAKQPNSSFSLRNRNKLSYETIEAMRHSALNREKFQYSDETLLNMKKNSKPIIVKELNGIVYGEYNSIIETAEALNCSAKTVYRTLKSSSKLLKKRWIVIYA